ncbi:MAG: hypothetical protein APF76_17560 [Desulfitibacter sp. BRH_c19]|nr:MAG: hypothetical protein APF76_17560 [Desulfitibacter sp. BRH_c19]
MDYKTEKILLMGKATIFGRNSYLNWSWLGGIIFTLCVAFLGYALATLPVFGQVGPMASAILIAVVYRQFFGYPEYFRTGIQFSSQKLLRLAIILYGLKLNILIIMEQGLGLLVYGVVTIVFSISITMLLARWLKADLSLSLLLGIGTGVCGAAAIAAVSPILKTKEEDTAMGVGIIALVGTIFAVGYTIIMPYLHLSPTEYGVWAGISLHEIAHVALAAAPAGQDVLAMALLAKLSRVLLLIPLSFILMFWMNLKENGQSTHSKIAFPWFLIGFIVMSFFGTFALGTYIPNSDVLMNDISIATSFLLTMAMTGLGLNVCLRQLKTKALRPLIAMSITSVLLVILTSFII